MLCNRHRAFEESQKTILFKVNEGIIALLKEGSGVKQALSITHASPWSGECYRYLETLRDQINPNTEIVLTPSVVKVPC